MSLLICAAAVFGLIILIAWFRVHAFVALIMASLFVGLGCGMEPADVGTAFQEGVGAVLGSVAVVIGLGAIIGKMLAESGGAQRLARGLAPICGPANLDWAIMLIALVVGMATFFAVGLVLLIPIVLSLAKETGTPLLRVGIPLVAGLSVAHGLLPPHPGPITAVAMLGADAGLTIIYGLVAGTPAAIIAGPLFARFAVRYVTARPDDSPCEQVSRHPAIASAPGTAVTLVVTLLPVVLMMAASAAVLLLPETNPIRRWTDFAGHPVFSLLLAVLLAFGMMRHCGFANVVILRFAEESLAAIASAVLVIGAGGGFNKVLVVSGIGAEVAEFATRTHLSPLMLGWLIAALVRIATGSATVAIATAAGLVAPLVVDSHVRPELLVLAMGAGSLVCSHVNDGGFWLVREYLNLSVLQTLMTWTVLETIISIVALAVILLLNLVL